ncbi:hypothetical protein VP1G_10643 [Cytospora mali]|uniref:Uncharacterized protein n=1 Tax=Cytospora mali TaxID=578113 RepID=A0A194UT37_CYTMA|nr:hypothetical protein VP1G_10643 [Valsa mali var. pyri (nom. inval.)]
MPCFGGRKVSRATAQGLSWEDSWSWGDVDDESGEQRPGVELGPRGPAGARDAGEALARGRGLLVTASGLTELFASEVKLKSRVSFSSGSEEKVKF